jgi:hypothetical protein
MGGEYSTHGADGNAYYVLARRSEGETSVRHRHRREDIVKMDVKQIGWEGVNWLL